MRDRRFDDSYGAGESMIEDYAARHDTDDYGRSASNERGEPRRPMRPGRATRTERAGAHPSRIPDLVRSVLRGEWGAALPDPSRWSARVGADVSRARIVTGPAAEQAALSIDARAFTVGNRIFLGAGAAAPGTPQGDRLLAHELVHVAQQPDVDLTEDDLDELAVTSSSDPSEREARDHAGGRGGAAPGRRGVQIARLAEAEADAETAVGPDVAEFGPTESETGAAADAKPEPPRLTRNEMIGDLWELARVPRHAIEKLPDHQLRTILDDIVRRHEAGGTHTVRVGDHDVTFTVEGGQLTRSTTKKRGFLSKLGGFVKIGLSFASFLPPPVGAAARAINAVVGVVGAIKKRNFFGAISSAIGAVAAGAQVFGAKSVAGLANAGSRLLRGAKSTFDAIKHRSLAAGVSGIAEMALAGSELAGKAGAKLAGFAKDMQSTARFLGAASKAKRAIEAARRGNVAEAITTGLGAISDAAGADRKLGRDLAKAAATLTSARGVYDAVKRGDLAAAAGQMATLASTMVGDEGAKQTLQKVGSALRGVQGLQDAFAQGDWLAVAAYGAEVASNLAGGKAGADLAGAGRVLHAATGLRAAIRSGDPEAIGAAAFALFDTARSEVKAAAERHAPQMLPAGKDYGDLLKQVPGVPGVVDVPPMRPDPTIVIDGGATVPVEPEPGASPPAIPYSPEVARAQEILNLWAERRGWSFGLAVDGKLGDETRAAIATFQTALRDVLTVNGRLDAPTMRALDDYRKNMKALDEARAAARTTVTEARAYIAQATKLSLTGNEVFYSAVTDLGKNAVDPLERKIDEAVSAEQLAAPMAKVREKMAELSGWIENAAGTLKTQEDIARAIKLGCDITIKALGKGNPVLYTAYWALEAAIPRAIEGDWTGALLEGAAGAVWAQFSMRYKDIDVFSFKEALAKQVSLAAAKMAQRIVHDIGEIKASSRDELRDQIAEVFRKNIEEATKDIAAKAIADLAAELAKKPLEKAGLKDVIDTDHFHENVSKVIREVLKKVVDVGSRAGVQKLIDAFPG